MSKVRILVVEDEGVVAEDIQVSLGDLGYEVTAMAKSGEEAIEKAGETRPDLVLMDVHLHGAMDGIEAAQCIHAELGIPIVYLTAFSDDEMLARAKVAEPFGYLIKPYRERELHSTIEIALFKHQLESELRENREWLSVTLRSIGDAVVATDRSGFVKFMNPMAELLTGLAEDEARGRRLEEVLDVRDEKDDAKVTAFVESLISGTGDPALARRKYVLESRDGTRRIIEAGVSPIRDGDRAVIGTVLVLRDITDIKKTEEALLKSHEALEAYSTSLEAKVEARTQDLEKSREQLKSYSESLEKTNKALKIIIEGIEEQKKEVENKITHNLDLTVKPILDQLKSQEKSETVDFLLRSLEFNLTNMFSSFGISIIRNSHMLTPREIRICEMVRSGLSSKQIAKVMEISAQTVLVHRKNIRKKLDLSKSRRNLASFLRSSPF